MSTRRSPADQGGVAARWQLRGEELAHVRRQVAAGRWQRVGRCVVAHNGPLTETQRLWVAVLHSGPGAALGGLTAAALGGLRGFADEQVHVLARHGAYVPPLPGVRVHRRAAPYDELVLPGGPPRLRMAPAVLQAAALRLTPRGACAVLAAAVQQRLVTPEQLRRTLLVMPRVPRRQLVVRVLGDLEGGAQALTEIDAGRLCRAAGLPAPDRQRIRRDGDGRRRYLDLDWERWRLAAEVEGRQHMEAVAWTADLDRQNEIVIPGDRTVLIFTSITLRTRPERFVDQVRRALLARGWPG